MKEKIWIADGSRKVSRLGVPIVSCVSKVSIRYTNSLLAKRHLIAVQRRNGNSCFQITMAVRCEQLELGREFMSFSAWAMLHFACILTKSSFPAKETPSLCQRWTWTSGQPWRRHPQGSQRRNVASPPVVLVQPKYARTLFQSCVTKCPREGSDEGVKRGGRDKRENY